MHKRKSKCKEEESNNNMKDILHERFISSEESKKNRLTTENTKLLRLEHLDTQERKGVINFISDSQDRFHIGEKLTAIQVLQYQIPTTDDRPINTRQYRFPQIHKEEINRRIEELLEGHRKAFSVII